MRCRALLSSESSKESGVCGSCHREEPRFAAGAKVTDSEGLVKTRYESQGWRVMHNGAPDFLMVKTEGSATRVLAVEVKKGRAPLTREQKEWRAALESAGIRYVVERTGRVLYRLGSFANGRKPGDADASAIEFARGLSAEIRRRTLRK